VYLKFFPDHFRALQHYCAEQGCLFSAAEDHFALPASSFLGILLCEHWLLPGKIRDACRWHSLKDLAALQSDTSPAGDFRRMVCLGNSIAVLAHEELSTEVKQSLAEAITGALRLTEADFLALMGTIYDLRLEAEDFMKKFT
jgi:HD-like signal output (HDOD) protein